MAVSRNLPQLFQQHERLYAHSIGRIAISSGIDYRDRVASALKNGIVSGKLAKRAKLSTWSPNHYAGDRPLVFVTRLATEEGWKNAIGGTWDNRGVRIILRKSIESRIVDNPFTDKDVKQIRNRIAPKHVVAIVTPESEKTTARRIDDKLWTNRLSEFNHPIYSGTTGKLLWQPKQREPQKVKPTNS